MDGGDIVLQSLQLRVANLCHPAVVALTFGTFGLQSQVLHLLLVLLNLIDELTFALPLGAELRLLFTEFGNVAVELGQLVGSR